MKKIIIPVALLSALALQSCDKGFEELNTDPTKTTKAFPEQFLANALMESVEYNMIRNRNLNNELMQVTVDIGDGDGKVFRYDFRRNWADYQWNGHFTNMSNYKDMYDKALEPLNYSRAYQAVSLICQSWVYSILTDTYGDIPYSKATLGRDSLILEPTFDAQKDIYVDIFKKLDSANTLLRLSPSSETISASADLVYAGDKAKWRKFGNSLMLRLLLRVAHKPEMTEYVEKLKSMLSSEASNYPIMTSNADAAILRWSGIDAYLSPYSRLRVQDFRAISLAAFFIDYLRDSQDPRIDISLYNSLYGTSSSTNNRWGISPISGNYSGIESGYAQSTGERTRQSYFYSSDQGVAVSLQTEPMTGMMMNFAELEFIKAELALKGLFPGDPKTFFYNGAKNSITLWMPGWTNDIEAHLKASDKEWNDEGSFDDKMEQIHMQKYLALFLVDNQQWFEYRRTGHPKLPKGNGLRNNGEMPARMYYPVYVQSSNPRNYRAAVERQGPDEINTKVWWQKP